jgi:solute carrier family 40 (iron-regulated transporter), member 1
MEIENGVLDRGEAYPYQWKLYLMHFFFTFTSRMWDTGIVFLIAELTDNSLFLVALSGLLNNLCLVLFMSSVGRCLDQTNRLKASEIALVIKGVTLTTAYALCAYLSKIKESSTEENSFMSHENYYLLYLIPVFSAVAALSFNTISQSVEKDWIVVLAAGNSNWLTSTNTMMTQIDLGVNSLVPVFTGYLFFSFSKSLAASILLCTNLSAAVFLYIFMYFLYYSWPALANRGNLLLLPNHKNESSQHSVNSNHSKQSAEQSTEQPPSTTTSWYNIYDDFFQSGCAGSMIAYAFLFLTVLNFGSLMTVYLRYAGISDGTIGLCRGLAALTGFTGAVIFPYYQGQYGMYTTSAIAILGQCLLVDTAAVSFFLFPPSITVIILMIAVLLSRTGLWMFDLGIRQIAQETIPEYCRGKVNGQWRSLTAFFEMTSYLLACIISGKY